jgi:hypothetical protein
LLQSYHPSDRQKKFEKIGGRGKEEEVWHVKRFGHAAEQDERLSVYNYLLFSLRFLSSRAIFYKLNRYAPTAFPELRAQ